jgi:crotonobetainyl-CoA:carnitine CoA-transferase CaiB-like acyl-CoA transferase
VPGLLDDITVVAVEQAVSAPFCTRTLADLGARVIKIEPPRRGDFARDYDDVVNGMAAHFAWLGRGKESVTLDLKQPAGLEVLHRLLAAADVLVSNLGPGATARLGIDQAALAARYPRLVSLEISGYGTTGPLAHKRAYDLLVQAESGACAITGWAGAPAKPGPPMADACTGLYGAITILAALHDLGRTGQARTATLSMFDTMVELMGYSLHYTRASGVNQIPVGMGSPAVAPYGAYPTADGQTVVLGTTNDAEWLRLASMIGRPDLGADPRYARNPGRVAARDALDKVIAGWCAARPLAAIADAADAAAIGNARYNVASDVLVHEQLSARGRWRAVGSPAGPVTSLLPPPVISGTEPRMAPIPGLGEHTAMVLAEFGYSEGQVAALRAAGVILRRPPAVDPHDRPRGVAGGVRGKVDDRRRDLLGASYPAHGDLGKVPRQQVVAGRPSGLTLHQTRDEPVHAHLRRAEPGKVLGHRPQRGLGRAVGKRGTAGPESGTADHVDHAAAAALDHRREERGAQPVGGEQVRRQRRRPVRLRDRQDGRGARPQRMGVVQQDVDLAELGAEPVREGSGVLLPGDVASPGGDGGTGRVRYLRGSGTQPGGVPGDHHDMRAGVRHGTRGRKADVAAGAGHHRDPAVEPEQFLQ